MTNARYLHLDASSPLLRTARLTVEKRGCGSVTCGKRWLTVSAHLRPRVRRNPDHREFRFVECVQTNRNHRWGQRRRQYRWVGVVAGIR